ncbi:phosphotransferase-like protein [Lichenicola sp.]|uniref:phosphotransferase-like protein n=1 Tax=Lichenicola sp. TaxID=2804529 RepID=UPI003B00BC5A
MSVREGIEGELGETPDVIILNGVGSVGKTSVARALQDMTARTFLHVSMDVFAAMSPDRMFGHPWSSGPDRRWRKPCAGCVTPSLPWRRRTLT